MHSMNTKIFVRSTLQALALLGFLGAGGAWGQAIKEILLTDKNGCQLYHPYPSYSEPQLLQVEGTCVNGFINGPVIYGVLEATNKIGFRIVTLNAGLMVVGRFSGARLEFNAHRWAYLYGVGNDFMWKDNKAYPTYSVDKFVNAVGDVAGKVSSARPDLLRAHLTQVAIVWDQNPDSVIQQYTTGIGGRLPTPRQGDDPKVFGRSMRGG
jgi:hypothetical protein